MVNIVERHPRKILASICLVMLAIALLCGDFRARSEAVLNLGVINHKGQHIPIRVQVGGHEAIFQHIGADQEGNAMFRVMASQLDYDDDVTLTIKARAVTTR